MLKDSNYKNNKKYETISILREYHNDNLDIVNNDPMLNSLSEIIDLTNQEKDEQEVNEVEEKEDTDVEDSFVKVKNKNKKVLREIQKNPPEVPSPQIPVSGDIPVTEYLPEDGLIVPVIGPVAKINGFISDRGSFFKTS